MLPIITPAARNEELSQARLALPSKYPSTHREFKLSSHTPAACLVTAESQPCFPHPSSCSFSCSPISVGDTGVASTVSAPTLL